MPDLAPLLVSRVEAARLLGVSVRTVQDLDLPIVRIGALCQYDLEDLREFIKRAKEEGARPRRPKGESGK
jgi:phage terminase Nu1 subunit (DNA packaging protein)